MQVAVYGLDLESSSNERSLQRDLRVPILKFERSASSYLGQSQLITKVSHGSFRLDSLVTCINCKECGPRLVTQTFI
jgi:hypothetical protein